MEISLNNTPHDTGLSPSVVDTGSRPSVVLVILSVPKRSEKIPSSACVKDRIPGIETADLEDEVMVVQLGEECQARGVSPSCIKHLRLLKRFLISLNAVRKGLSPPKLKLCGQKVDDVSDKRLPTDVSFL